MNYIYNTNKFMSLINNAYYILKGWTYTALNKFKLLPIEIREISERRMAICDSCEYNEINQGKRSRCSICTCLLPEKTFVIESECPLNKW